LTENIGRARLLAELNERGGRSGVAFSLRDSECIITA
jgi:hypothetical protein